MHDDTAELMEALASLPIVLLLSAGLMMSLAAWWRIARRWRSGQPLVEFEPRRPAPWNWIDVLIVLAIYLLAWMAALRIARVPPDPVPPAAANEAEADVPPPEQTAAHPVARLLETDASPAVVLLCWLSVVIVAPLAEEFFFRLLLQGWFESLDVRARQRDLGTENLRPTAGPLVSVAAMFALLHFRRGSAMDPDLFLRVFMADAAARLLAVVLGVIWIRFRAEASWRDLGVAPERFGADLKLGVVSFGAILVPLYAIQIGLTAGFPEIFSRKIAPDPIPLFLLALVLGYLYLRTHRILPAIVLHMCLNAYSLTLALLSID
jgi:membrane protease YdiL (CAAX protease family)